MNEYKGYTLTDITIIPLTDITIIPNGLHGYIYHPSSELKQGIVASTIKDFLDKFHSFVDDDILKQSELVNCQNFADELVELCEKYGVRLSAGISYLYVNDRLLKSYNNDSINMIDGCNHVLVSE